MQKNPGEIKLWQLIWFKKIILRQESFHKVFMGGFFIMLEKIKNECKLLCVALCIGLVFALGVAALSYAYSMTVQRDIAENVIRFHVLAHSDDYIDQALKDFVTSEILAEFEDTLLIGNDLNQTRDRLIANLSLIEDFAQQKVSQAGFTQSVSANMGSVFFPTRRYGEMVFPPGEYETVQIIIGDGLGSNWWCLMFPPLCFVDFSVTEVSRNYLEETVPAAGFLLLTHEESSSTELKVRFRVVEWWQNRRAPSDSRQSTPLQIAGH